MSGRRRAEIEAAIAHYHAVPELDQYLAAMRDWARLVDELDALGELWPWQPRRLIRARRLLRQCEAAHRVAAIEQARLEAYL